MYASDATAPSYFAGSVGVGSAVPGAKLDINAQNSGQLTTIKGYNQFMLTSGEYSGVLSTVDSTPVGNYTNSVNGGKFVLTSPNSNTQTSGEYRGVYADVSNNGFGTRNSVIGGRFDVYSLSGTTTNSYGVQTSVTTTAGTNTNAYGVYTGSVQGTNKWSFYASDTTAPSYFSGKVGIGAGTSNPSYSLDVGGTIYAAPSTGSAFKGYMSPSGNSGTVTGVDMSLSSLPSAAYTTSYTGGSFNLTQASTYNQTSGAYSAVSGTVQKSGSGTVANATGGQFSVTNSTGTTTTATGVSASVVNGGTVTNAYGVNAAVLNTGTATNLYGVYIGWVLGGTNNFSLYASDTTAPSYFASKVGIGTTGPNAKLDINQTTAGSAAFLAESGGTNFLKILNPAGGITTTYNAADAVLYVGSDTSTSRSINASGTVNSGGADFAEWVDWPNSDLPKMGSVVLFKGGYVVISSAHTAAFVGNDNHQFQNPVLVAFAGQLPVLVSGKVREGDLIVANSDGTASAIPRDQVTMEQARNGVGTAWASSDDPGLKRVNVAVGIGLGGNGGRDVASLRERATKLEVQNLKLQEENQNIKSRLEKLESLLGPK
jgi:hypothetical protein